MTLDNYKSLLVQLQQAIPRRPFVPTVLEIAGATICPRSSLLKLIYGATGENNAGFAIGTVTHSVLAHLGKIERTIVDELDPSLPASNLAQQVYDRWQETAITKIDESWRLFADARTSVAAGRTAVLDRLHSFSRHLAEEIRDGYRRPDRIVTGHHITNLDLPLQGVPDEYRVYNSPLRIEIREFKSYGGSRVNEINKLQACGYQLLLEQIYPEAEFTIRVISTDDVVNVRMTDRRRSKLHQGISTIQEIYETVRGVAVRIPNLCEVCSVNEGCEYYFHDNLPRHFRRYLWRLRMETLEEKGLNQIWRWRSKILPLEARIQLGYSDEGYHISDLHPENILLEKSGRVKNLLPGDTVIVSMSDPLSTPNFTGEISSVQENSITITPYGDIPLGLAKEGLTIDRYDVDLTRRQLRSIDAAHRAGGRHGDIIRKILGITAPTIANPGDINFIGDLNNEQRQAVISAIYAPDYMVILGPPGTGKTAVIVEVLAQLAKEGKRALAVSVTNTAVDNIVERLLDKGHKFGIRFGNWFKIREKATQVSLINIVTNDEDRALAAVEKMRSAAAVLTTCSSASLDLVKLARFDVVLFEESSQIRMQDALAALVQGEKAIIIGDDKQLSPVSQIHARVNSLLEIALYSLERHNVKEELVTTLRLQYRMQKEICELINRKFYEGILISSPIIETRSPLPETIQKTDLIQLDKALNPDISIALIDIEGLEEHRGYSYFNRANLKVDSLLVSSLKSSGLTRNQIGLITPYKEQQRLFTANFGNDADVGTVDSFQGQERDVIIFDMVRANPEKNIGFTLQPNRLNVALSRARKKLLIITNMATFQDHQEFDQIIEIIRSLPNTCVEHISADQLGINLPDYRRLIEIKVRPSMVGVDEPEDQPPSASTLPGGDYSDIY